MEAAHSLTYRAFPHTVADPNGIYRSHLAENATIHLSNRWKILQESTGYVFLHKGLSTNALTATDSTEGANVILATKTSYSNCHWMLELATGLFLRDTTTQRAIHTTPEITIALGQSYTLADLGLKVEHFGTLANSSWAANSTSNYDIASVDTNGTVTPNYGGVSTITRTMILDDIGFSVSYTLISILPLSNSELEYEPDVWNNNYNIDDEANCYAYILNVQINPSTGTGWKLQPGELSGHSSQLEISDMRHETIIYLVNEDSSEKGFVFSRVEKEAVCDQGCYKIVLVIALNKDFHWYRQNPDGTWSHKVGSGPVTNRDSDGNVIYDPDIASKDYTDDKGHNYIDYICYFQVSPLNYFYDGSSAMSASVSTSIYAHAKNSISITSSRISFDVSVP